MPVKVILTDIEGTTTSISFVKDHLFPYAVENVQEYLNENWTEANVKEAVKELREQNVIDVTDKFDGVVVISDGEGKDQSEQIAEIVANVKWQISIDRKTTSLKKLQGLIWAKGYSNGTIKGHVYPDVPKAFERWSTDNIKVYIYSSGSVNAQKLLFGNSEHGDITSKITGYFDTVIGAKQEKESYEKIIKEVGCDASEILFLTDIVNEAVAAKQSGMQVAILVREGNGPLTDEEKAEYQVLTSFDDVALECAIGKRKLEDVLTAETNAVKIPKLSDEESVISNVTNTESVPETNGIDRTDSDTKMETCVSNGSETDLTIKNEETETIPITKHCDLNNKNDNLDVDVVREDTKNGEKDSKPLTVDEVIKESEALPMEVVEEKSSEIKVTEDIEMEATPIDTEINNKPKSDKIDDDESTKIADIVADVDCENVKEQVPTNPEIIPEVQTDKADLPEKVGTEEIVEKASDEKPSEQTTDLKQNGDHTTINVESGNEKVEEAATKQQIEKTEKTETTDVVVESESNEIKGTNQKTDVEVEKVEKIEETTEKDEQVATIENGAKENDEIDNKENIPVDTIKEKENIIEIPIQIDGDMQSAQKPSIISAAATNGNGVTSKDDLEVTAATNSNKEKISRIELIIEEKNNDNGQLTETTTHIVKEITIVKNSVCESVENVEKITENV